MAVRRRTRGRAAPRRKKIWARTTIANATLAGASTTHSLVLGSFETAYGAQLIGATIARVRLSLFTTTPTAPGGLIYGVRVADADAFGDLSPVPNIGPGSRPGLDWMAWGTIFTESSTLRAVREVDVRSMRKVEELSETLVLSIENAGADEITWGGAISVLVMLP